MGLNQKILEDYVNRFPFYAISTSCGKIKIKSISKLGGGISNDVHSLLLADVEGEKGKRLILKMYNNDSEKALREYEILSALESSGFPVPHVYLYEENHKILGKPFIIMDEAKGKPMDRYIEKLNGKSEERKRRIQEIVELFAQTLARLHKLRWESLNLNKFNPPGDEYEYARKQPIILKFLIKYFQQNLHKKINEDFTSSISWLQSNAELNPCGRYSIIHGDYSPSNVIITDDEKAVVIDWESAEIGDPLADVGYAYHFVRLIPGPRKVHNEGKELAEYFISSYEKAFGASVNEGRLEFYKVSAALKLTVFLNFFIRSHLILKSLKWMLLYPLLYWFLRGWRNYVKDFVKKHVFNS